MPSPVQFNVSAGTLPPNFTGTPQQFLDAIAGLLLVTPVEDWNSFVVGSAAPTSDVGPWLKNGQEWWVWSSTAGAYVPLILDDLSIRRFIGETAPLSTEYDVWIQTNSSGVPQAVKIYNAGNWVDVYAATLSNYYTKAEYNTAFAKFQTYAGNNQFITAGALASKVDFDAVSFQTGVTFDTTNHRFVAPATGYYSFTASLRMDNTASSTPTGQSINIEFRVNGVPLRYVEHPIGTAVVGNTFSVSAMASLTQNDYVEVWVQVGIGTGSATWQVTSDSRKSVFEGFRIS